MVFSSQATRWLWTDWYSSNAIAPIRAVASAETISLCLCLDMARLLRCASVQRRYAFSSQRNANWCSGADQRCLPAQATISESAVFRLNGSLEFETAVLHYSGLRS